MNIFYLDNDPKTCAQMHVDKHCVKMILEYGQLLSTAHRILDGVLSDGYSANGRKRKSYTLSDHRDSLLYSATHANHPSAIWARGSAANYQWLYSLFIELLAEYTYRYGKQHATSKLVDVLAECPKNIPTAPFTEPTPAMPDYCKVPGDSIKSYHNYYINEKGRMAVWKNRPVPKWYVQK